MAACEESPAGCSPSGQDFSASMSRLRGQKRGHQVRSSGKVGKVGGDVQPPKLPETTTLSHSARIEDVAHNPKVTGSNPVPATKEDGRLATKLTGRFSFGVSLGSKRSSASASADALLGAVDTAHSTLACYPQRDALRAVGAHVLHKNITTSTFDTASGPPPRMTAP